MHYCRYFLVRNLERASPEEKVKLCKKYFYIGFFALPVVWLVKCSVVLQRSFLQEWQSSDAKTICDIFSHRFPGLGSIFCHMDISVSESSPWLGSIWWLYLLQRTSWWTLTISISQCDVNVIYMYIVCDDDNYMYVPIFVYV